jgi:hypothetical protein
VNVAIAEVRNPDGTLVTRREFEGALKTSMFFPFVFSTLAPATNLVRLTVPPEGA